jgi:hypothetical protein
MRLSNIENNIKKFADNVGPLTQKLEALDGKVDGLVKTTFDLINKDEALKNSREKVEQQKIQIDKYIENERVHGLHSTKQSTNIGELKLKVEQLKLENDNTKMQPKLTRFVTLSFEKFEKDDWFYFVFYVSIIIILSFAFGFYIHAVILYKKIPNLTTTTSKKTSCILFNKLNISFELIPSDFDAQPWDTIIANIENAKNGSLWNHVLECQIKDAIQNNIEININDLAFFFGEVWSKYVFQFEHETEGWEWSKKIICDSLPGNSKIEFKLRLPNIGASHSVTKRNGIAVRIDSGSGPKITKIIHPGCEIINLENREIIFSMPASVEMGD